MTKIEWVKNQDGTPGETWNLITGCSPCSEGCLNCYAKKLAEGRLKGRYGYPADDPFRVKFHPERLIDIQKLRSKPCTIFVCSMGDLFHDDVEFLQLWEIFQKIRYELAFFQQHKFIILTKRPKRMFDFWNWHKEETGKYPNEYKQQIGDDLHVDWTNKIYPNIWLGISVENQERVEERILWLFRIRAAVRLVSAEPLLGPIDFKMSPAYIDWIICGGETGPGARPMHPDWVRSIRDQCIATNIPFFFKSWGEWVPGVPSDDSNHGGPIYSSLIFSNSRLREYHFKDGRILKAQSDEYCNFAKVGPKQSGNILDGQTWNQIPEMK